MAQINSVRLPDGRVVRPTEWSSTPLFSSVEIDDGNLTPLQGFSYGVGGPVPGSVGQRKSTAMDTNMQGTGGVLPENEELLLFSIMVSFFQKVSSRADYETGNDALLPAPPHMSALNMARIQQFTILKLGIAATKDYAQHPVGFFPAAMGVHMALGSAVNANLNTGYHVGYNGGLNVYENRRFATPHRVGPGEAFDVTLEFPLGSITGLDFGDDTDARVLARIYCDGYRRRPVA